MTGKAAEKTMAFAAGVGSNIGTSFLVGSHPVLGALLLGVAALAIAAEGFIQKKGEPAARAELEKILRTLIDQGKTLAEAISLASAEAHIEEMVSRDRAAKLLGLMRRQHASIKELVEADTELLLHVGRWIETWCTATGTRIESLADQFDQAAAELGLKLDRIESKVEKGAVESAAANTLTHHKLDQVLSVLQPDLDKEIDDGRDVAKRGRYDEAITILARLLNRSGTLLTARQKFRIHAHLGYAFEGKDDYETAGEHYVEGQKLQPGDPRAECLLFAANKYRGLAGDVAELRREFPDEPLAHALWIRSEGSSLTLDELKATIPEQMQDEIEVNVALAMQTAERKQWEDAEQLVRAALQREPENVRVKTILGEMLVDAEISRATWIDDDRAIPADAAKVHEAISLLTNVIATIGFTAGPRTVSHVRRARGLAYTLLGEKERAEQDFLSARERDPENPSAAIDYALMKIGQGSFDAAIEALRPVVERGPAGTSDVQLAVALSKRNKGNDRDEAIQILRNALGNAPNWHPALCAQAVLTFVDVIRLHAGGAAALSELDAQRSLLSPVVACAIESRMKRTGGDRDGASAAATAALASLTAESPMYEKRLVAEALVAVQRFREALPVWTEIVQPRYVSDDTLQFLTCASKCREDGLALDFCRELRSNGVYDASCIDLETTTLCDYHGFSAAIEILQEYLSKSPEAESAKIARLRLSTIAIELDRPELVEQDLSRLPDVKTVSARVGEAVVHVLSHGADTFRAVEYAYELIRRHPEQEPAHRALIRSFLFGMTERPIVPESDVVIPGFAVIYKHTEGESASGFVIEDSLDLRPSIERDELAPDDPRALELRNKKTGDRFFLRRDSIQDVEAEIIEIIHKSVYRLRDALNHFERRFQSKFLFTVNVRTPDGGYDFTPVFRSVDQQVENTNLLDNLFRSNRLPVTAYAALKRSSVLEAFEHACGQPGFLIWSSLGSDAELTAARALLSDAKEVVLSPSTCATWLITGIYKSLRELPFKPIVTHGVLTQYRDLYEELVARAESRGFLTKIGNRHVFLESSVEQVEERKAYIREFIEWLERNSLVVDGTPLAYLDRAERKNLRRNFGAACAESIAVARARDCVLLEEDLGVADIAAAALPLRRAWTQAVLYWLVENSRLDEADHHRHTIRLLELGFRFIRINAATVLHALDVAAWDVGHASVVTVLRAFGDEMASMESVVRVSVALIRAVWSRDQTVERKLAVMQSLLDQLGGREEGKWLAARVGDVLRHLSVYDIQLFFAWQYVRNWFHTGSVTNAGWW